jgi:NAD(P)H-hydrate epimerase
MKVATAREMREIDRATIEEYGIAGGVLMERAGASVARLVRESHRPRKVLVLAGSGNNGGDGLVVARELHNNGYATRVLMTGRKSRQGGECAAQAAIARKMGVPMEFRAHLTQADTHGALVVDAIFGTGLGKPVTGEIASIIEAVNASHAPVVSVDIPSGVSADTGEVMGVAIRAGATVTFGLPKRGHYLHPGAEHTGTLHVADIGFPRGLFAPVAVATTERAEMAMLLPERPAYSHKGTYGHALVVAGSFGRSGAALMTARSCLRAGAGLVTLGVPDSLASSLTASVLEEMILPLPDDRAGRIRENSLGAALEFLDSSADVLVLGPGVGREADTVGALGQLITSCARPMVIDADALAALENNAAAILGRVRAPVVLTPHPGEFSRISGLTRDAIERDRIEHALGFARKTGAVVVLKGVPTVVASPDGSAFINTTGNAGMATAGSGDVLTGIIGGFMAQGVEPTAAAVLGVYVHGLAGDLCARRGCMHSIIASDMIGTLPGALSELSEGVQSCTH